MTLGDFVVYVNYFVLGYFLVINAAYLILYVISFAEIADYVRRDPFTGLAELFSSNYAQPATVVVPAYNEEATISDSVRSFRTFHYPLHEVVAVILGWGKVERPVAESDGVKQVSTVKDAYLAVYDGNGWEERFWTGMNLGAKLPGHAPGELAPPKGDYLRWFEQIEGMNVDVLRVYTILNPEFYEAFREFNSTREEPLWLIQGIWSPEEELTGEDLEGRDAYEPKITEISGARSKTPSASSWTTPTCRSARATRAGGSARPSPSTCSGG